MSYSHNFDENKDLQQEGFFFFFWFLISLKKTSKKKKKSSKIETNSQWVRTEIKIKAK